LLGGLLAEATGGRDIARAGTNGGLSGVTFGGDKRLTASMGSGGGAGFGGGDGGLSGIDDTVGGDKRLPASMGRGGGAGFGGRATIAAAAPTDASRQSRCPRARGVSSRCPGARGVSSQSDSAPSASAHGFAPVFGSYDAGTRTIIRLCSLALVAISFAKATRPGSRHSSPFSATSISLYRLVWPPNRCAGVQSSWTIIVKSHAWR